MLIITRDDYCCCCGHCSKCRDYDCRDVDSAHLAQCLRLRPCHGTAVTELQAWRRSGPLLPLPADSLRLMKACIKAHCTSNADSTPTVDVDCTNVCFRQLRLTDESPVQVDQWSDIEPAKRAGFTDTAGACMAFHCGGKSPGTLEFLLCASRNRCAG